MFCEKCSKVNICIKLCDKVDKLLKVDGIHSSEWIRPRVSSKKCKDGYGKWREIPLSRRIYEQFRDKNV